MSDLTDAVGTIPEGGLYARFVESKTGEDDHTHETACLNCGTALVGSHCHNCGQHAHIHRTLGAFMHDLLHGALHFEGKVWHTLPMLCWRPGELTRRYIAGERARFVSPMALFLFTVFVMFAVLQIEGVSPPADVAQATQETTRQAGQGVSSAKVLADNELAEATKALASLAPDDPGRAAAQERLDSAKTAQAMLERGEKFVINDSFSMTFEEAKTGWKRLDKGIAKARTNPSLMLYKLMTNSYKFSWLLIPLSLPFVWLLFAWKRNFGLYDHAIFVTYSIAFMSLLFIVLMILGGFGVSATLLGLAATVIPLWHLQRQLKRAYGLTNLSATWRAAVMVFLIGLVLALFLVTLIVLGLLG